jgi:hypothetical protein
MYLPCGRLRLTKECNLEYKNHVLSKKIQPNTHKCANEHSNAEGRKKIDL